MDRYKYINIQVTGKWTVLHSIEQHCTSLQALILASTDIAQHICDTPSSTECSYRVFIYTDLPDVNGRVCLMFRPLEWHFLMCVYSVSASCRMIQTDTETKIPRQTLTDALFHLTTSVQLIFAPLDTAALAASRSPPRAAHNSLLFAADSAILSQRSSSNN